MAKRKVDGYPQPAGAKIQMVVEIDGPTSYVVSGQVVTAKECGMKGIDVALPMASDNGAYTVIARSPKGRGTRDTVVLEWYTAGGIEVVAAVDLSARVVRLLVQGN